MRIALASPYDFATHGGVNQHIERCRREYERRGHEVVVIAPLSDPSAQVDTKNFHGFGGIVPLAVNGSVARISFSLNRRRVKALMSREAFDIVHCHEPLMPALPMLVLNYSRAVNVGTFHAYAESNLGYFYARPVLQRVVKKLDGMIAVSPPARDFASQYFDGVWRIIPNGVDSEALAVPAEPIPELMDGRPNILFLGRFGEPRKGFKYALRALRWVAQVIPDIRLVVVGRGDPRRPGGRARKMGIAENVHFAGTVTDEDRARYMASCQFLVAPSTRGESQGVVLLEAMAAGLPVVAGNIPGYASVVTHGREGFLVEPENEQALAVAVVRLASDPELRRRMGEAGRIRAQDYSWPKVAGELLDYYEELLDARARDIYRRERRQQLRVALKKARRA